MKKKESFPYLKAVSAAVTDFIDHFSMFVRFAAGWTVFTVALLFFSVMSLGLYCGSWHSLVAFETTFVQISLCLQQTSWLERGTLLFCIGILLIGYLELLYYCVVQMGFALYHDQSISLKALLGGPIKVIRFICARAVYDSKVFGGLLLFLIPGCFIGSRDFYVGYSFLDDTASSPSGDTAFARRLSHGYIWQLFFIFLVHGSLVMALTFNPLTFLFSILFVWPVVGITDVHLYYFLKEQVK